MGDQDQIMGAHQEQLRQLNEFRSETKFKLNQIDEHLNVLADVKAAVQFIRESQTITLTKIGSFDEKINDLYGRNQKAHGRIDILNNVTEGHSFWLRTIGVSVAIGILTLAGSALLWVLIRMGSNP